MLTLITEFISIIPASLTSALTFRPPLIVQPEMQLILTAFEMLTAEVLLMCFRNVSVSPALAAARASSRESYLTLVVSLTTTGSAGVGVGASLVGSAEPSPSSRVLRLPLLLPPSRYVSSPLSWTPSFTTVGAELEVFPPSSSTAYALPPNRLMHIATRRRMDKNLVTFFMFSVSLYCCFLFSPIYITFGRILHDFPPRSSV